MHSHSVEQWTHDHAFLGEKHDENERRTWLVVVLTLVMMVGEIVAGSLFGSMALLADGWHMGTHAAALGIAAFAYRFARRHLGNAHFTFGTGKFGDLAAFSSAIILGLIAVEIAYESVLRLFASSYFGGDVHIRFRPSFFPFTEPSAEMFVSCFICGGSGKRGNDDAPVLHARESSRCTASVR